jgi:hypothetical protein
MNDNQDTAIHLSKALFAVEEMEEMREKVVEHLRRSGIRSSLPSSLISPLRDIKDVICVELSRLARV